MPLKFKTVRKKKNHKNHKKLFFTNRNKKPFNSWSLNTVAIINEYIYNKKPYQLLLQAKTLFNYIILIPGVESLTPGKVIYNFLSNIDFKKPSYLGSQITLIDLPFYVFINSIANNLNNKLSYARSSGSFATKIKAKKTVKLILVKLPSEKLYFFIKNVKCYIGKNTNFFNNKFIEGKWGFSIHNKKKISVRGVAMNPVDHPNGGRTKSKQPEKSP